jgi:hypothetical protein
VHGSLLQTQINTFEDPEAATMGLDDLFQFDAAAYRAKVRTLSDDALRQRQCIKTRQNLGGAWSVGFGIGGAVFTGGLSLIGTAYGARRMSVAQQKIEIVNEEMARRGAENYEERKRDTLIPCAIGVLTAGIGFGIDDLCASATIGTLATQELAHRTAEETAREVICHPEHFADGVKDGFALQIKEVSHIATTGLSDKPLGLAVLDTGNPVPGEILGRSTGVVATQKCEVLLGQVTTGRLEKLDTLPK